MSKSKYLSSVQQEQKIMKVKLTQEQIESIVNTLNPSDEVVIEDFVPEMVIEEDFKWVSTSLDYIKWSNDIDTHIGILTIETNDTYTLLTKKGEVTIPKNNGLFFPSSREEFETFEVVEQVIQVVGETKMAKATSIYQQMITDSSNRRIDIINKFVSELGISKAMGSTYHQTIKVKLNK